MKITQYKNGVSVKMGGLNTIAIKRLDGNIGIQIIRNLKKDDDTETPTAICEFHNGKAITTTGLSKDGARMLISALVTYLENEQYLTNEAQNL